MADDNLTVLVLGAGASKPYEFPTGPELVRDLTDWMWATEVVNRLGISSQEYSKFEELLRASGQYSIDRFLELRPEFAELGRALIASRIAKGESRFTGPSVFSCDWYQWLLHSVLKPPIFETASGVGDWLRQIAARLRIVTFNYDRSFELGLSGMIADSYRLNRWDVFDQLAAWQIVHVYGTLSLDWRKWTGREREWGRSRDEIIRASSGIELLRHDNGIEESLTLQEARKCLRRSCRVIFLGFGFDSLNLKRIGALGIMNQSDGVQKRVWFSAYGLEHAEVVNVRQMLGDASVFADEWAGPSMPGPCVFGVRTQGCLEFLRSLVLPTDLLADDAAGR